MVSDRVRRLALPLAALFVGIVALGVALVLVLNPGHPRGTASAVGGPFTLVDQDGRTITDKDFAGEPFLVFFGFTHCPDVCPTALSDISQVFAALGDEAGKARALFITVDPQRDRPDVLKTYLESFDPRIVGATGTPDEVNVVTKAYKAYARRVELKDGGYTMDHTALVYLMDKSGRFVGGFNLKRPPGEAAAELRRYL